MPTSKTTRLIKATPDIIYNAFTNPAALEVWMVPGTMTGKIHSFDGSIGGGYTMSLYYPKGLNGQKGKSAANEDRYTARFITLDPYKRIVLGIQFDTGSRGFVGEMIMEVQLGRNGSSTQVTIIFTNLPLGVRPEDNAKGTEESLDKLERYLASGSADSIQ